MNEKIIHSVCKLVQNDNKLTKTPPKKQIKKEKLLPVNTNDLIEEYLKENDINFKQINSNQYEINGQYLILIITFFSCFYCIFRTSWFWSV